jgi:carbon monoxide dehydrogenase subunit G
VGIAPQLLSEIIQQQGHRDQRNDFLELLQKMLILGKFLSRPMYGCSLVALIFWVFSSSPSLGADYSSRLAAGQIITHVSQVPGSAAARRGEVIGVVDASPEKVWQVVIDANNFEKFLPRMIRSKLVRSDELKTILQVRPKKASEAEALLGLSPPDIAHFRTPGGKYTGYFYGHVEVPWPVGNRWYIVKVQWDETQAARHIYTCSWSFIIGSLRENKGEWKVEPFGENRTLLTYQVVTDPGAFAPKFLVDNFTNKTLPQVITGVRRRVAYQ